MPAGDRYVEVPFASIETFLSPKGFERNVAGNEIVFDKHSVHCPHVTIRVYTSVRNGSSSARSRGKDAIRVVAFYEGPKRSAGIYKGARILRTGSVDAVLARMLERLKEARTVVVAWMARNSCDVCSK